MFAAGVCCTPVVISVLPTKTLNPCSPQKRSERKLRRIPTTCEGCSLYTETSAMSHNLLPKGGLCKGLYRGLLQGSYGGVLGV